MVLLDTCCLLWLVAGRRELSIRARKRISESAGSLFISAITAFEIAIKHRKGRLTLPMKPEKWIEQALEFHGIAELPIDWRVASRSALLPPHHEDPCDRMIIATAELRNLPILSPDPLLKAYAGVQVDW